MDVKKIITTSFKIGLFFGLGVGILYLLYQHQSVAYQNECALQNIPPAECSLMAKIMADFGRTNYLWIFLVLVVFTVSNISRSIKWKMLLQPLGFRPRFVNLFLTIILGYFANLGLPRIGEFVRAGALSRYERIPVEKVIGTIVVDRTIDVMCIVLVSLLAVLLQFQHIAGFFTTYGNLSEKWDFLSSLGVYVGLGAIVSGGLVYVFRKPLWQSLLVRKIISVLHGFWQGIITVRNLKRPWVFIFHSLNIWLMYYLMTYFCFFAFPATAHLSPLAGLLVFVFGAWGIVIPTPGGMGAYHFLAQKALEIFGVNSTDGFSWANISYFSIQIGCNVLVGIFALIFLPFFNRNYKPTVQTT